LTEDDIGFSLLIREHEITMFYLAADEAAFADAANAVATFNVNMNARLGQCVGWGLIRTDVDLLP